MSKKKRSSKKITRCKKCNKFRCDDGTFRHLDGFEMAVLATAGIGPNSKKIRQVVCPDCK